MNKLNWLAFLIVLSGFLLSCSGDKGKSDTSSKKDNQSTGNTDQKLKCTCLRQGISIAISSKSKEEATQECSAGVSPGKITNCENSS